LKPKSEVRGPQVLAEGHHRNPKSEKVYPASETVLGLAAQIQQSPFQKLAQVNATLRN
jgi:hypothetical protein